MYEDYLKKLKGYQPPLEGERQWARISSRLEERRPVGRLALAGALAVLLIGVGLYYNYRPAAVGREALMADYVFQQSSVEDNLLLQYVFVN